MAEEAMNKALEHLDKSFINIRAGKANPGAVGFNSKVAFWDTIASN